MFYIVLGVYAVVYASVFVAPLVSAVMDLQPGESLERLRAQLQAGARGEERSPRRAASSGEDTSTVYRALADSSTDAPTSGSSEASSGGQLDDASEEEEEEEEPSMTTPPARTAQVIALERLTQHSALVARYPSPLVQDAVNFIRVQYPGGAYHKIDIERLPTYLVFAERMTMARRMASLFVLLGLVLTMTKLNGVVGDIAAVTQTSATQEQFMERMSGIMQSIGGAFIASIWGLWLMLAALAVLALVDLIAQRIVAAVDREFAGRIVPELAALHQALHPDLSLGDLLAKTGMSLGSLNTTVEGLTRGMAEALADLGHQIRDMLQDFGRFEQHYVKLDGLLHSIGKAGQQLQKVTGGLEVATHRLAEPLNEFTRNVDAHLALVRTHLETVGDATAANIEGYRETADQLLTVKAHTDEIVQAVQALLNTRVDGLENRHIESLQLLRSQSEKTNHLLSQLIKAAEAPVSMRPALPVSTRVTQTLGSGASLATPGSSLPPTLFLWVAGGVIRAVNYIRTVVQKIR